MKYARLAFLFLCLLPMTHAYEQAFAKTTVDTIEIKTIPASTVIRSHTGAGYFDQNNQLFRPLFRYIQTHDIAMTTPVEAEIDPGAMYFYIGGEAAERDLPTTESVEVKELPARTVLSIGIRGSYSQKNFTAAKQSLEAWLAAQKAYQQSGPARAIYWNGPFTLGIFKRAEVHIPVTKSK